MKRYYVPFIVMLVLSLSPVYAQRPDAPPFAQRGPYSVGVQDQTIDDADRPLPVTIWYPAALGQDEEESTTYGIPPINFNGQAARDSAPDTSSAPYPLVIFSHGNAGTRLQSTYFTEHLASYGFIVVAVDHPGNTLLESVSLGDRFNENIAPSYAYRPQDVERVIDYARTLNAEDTQFAGLIDLDRIATTGHSFGGYTALASAGAVALNFDQLTTYCARLVDPTDDNTCFLLNEQEDIASALSLDTIPLQEWPALAQTPVQAVVAFAPWNGPIMDDAVLNTFDVPTMLVVGTSDPITLPERDAYAIFEDMFTATPKALVQIENAGHYVYVNACNEAAVQFGLFGACSDAVWDMARAHDLINHLATAFLMAELYDDSEAAAALAEADFTGVNVEYITATVETLVPDIISTRPHDPDSFTQGLLLHEGVFYESAGNYGESDVRRVDPETGEVLAIFELPDNFFAEGLALVNNLLYQITWREGTAIVYDLETLQPLGTYQYTGQGWGLCYDGEYLYMTDSTSVISVRDPDTFNVVNQIPVTLRGEPVNELNELECVGDDIYANVWRTDYIMRIDKATGAVTARIDAAGLLTEEERAQADVLNGIAYDPENDVFYITGKDWPKLFEVRFVPAETAGD
ncbi:MAG: hypothetical protein OHK0046_05560 [Anaerolineae bacterium]